MSDSNQTPITQGAKQLYQNARRKGHSRPLSLLWALSLLTPWFVFIETTRRRRARRRAWEEKRAEAARERSSEIDDWSEVVDRER